MSSSIFPMCNVYNMDNTAYGIFFPLAIRKLFEKCSYNLPVKSSIHLSHFITRFYAIVRHLSQRNFMFLEYNDPKTNANWKLAFPSGSNAVSVCLPSKPLYTARLCLAIHQALYPVYRIATCISLNGIYTVIDHQVRDRMTLIRLHSTKETISIGTMIGRLRYVVRER